MELLPSGVTVVLYAVCGLFGSALAVMWLVSKRDQRNAGFAAKALLRRHLSAKAVTQATEIRPGLLSSTAEQPPAGISLAKADSSAS
ncbi:hypothetical protein ACFRJ1_07055 [Streptomyces sp. NPDC056773]|uniref:hypothetical protein n=1 Tax=unclassified Streptomyces TaxID=2593676 RepID=UPI0036C344D6